PALSATTLESFGNVAVGTTAGPKSFTLTGSNLTGNVTVGALTGFTYSTTETGTYANSLTLTPSSGSINQTIYVKFTPTAVQSYNGNITISSQGATSINVAAQGSGILAAPTATAATNVSATGFTANWNAVPGATGYKLNVYTKTGTNATDLFISEYGEGSGGNKKYVEIFNGTGNDVDLSNYVIKKSSNGGGWIATVYSFPASTVLTNGSTFVLANNSTDVIGATAYDTFCNWNGDDAIGLFKNDGLIDIFGVPDSDPGTGWSVAGITNATVDHILIRKPSVTSPTTDWAASAGTTADNSQWTVSDFVYDATNQTTNLGSHTMSGGTSTPVSGSPFIISSGSTTSYTLSGLSTNTTYYYTVEATSDSYTSTASNEISVALSGPEISVQEATIPSLSTTLGNSAVTTITVSGVHLTEAISLSLSGTDAAKFSVSPASLTPTGGTVSATSITITYTPSDAGTHTATLTLSSSGATTVTRSLTGSCTPPAPVATDATDITASGFMAHWNAVTEADAYDLSVYTKTGNATDLIISEYVEGDNNNKYLEIYNGTSASIDLSNYKLLLFANGATNATYTVTLSGTLAAGKTIVYKNSLAALTLPVGVTAFDNAAINFNGDDAIALYKNSTDTYVDIFGRIGEDPGTKWTADGGIETENKTLRRKSSVSAGVTTNPDSGFPTLSEEWEVFDQNEAGGLGTHAIDNALPNQVTGSPFQNIAGTSYTLTGLTTNTTYYYSVKAKKSGVLSAASNEITVTLAEHPLIYADPETIPSFTTNVEMPVTTTITVSGIYLNAPLTLSVGEESLFSVSPASLTPTNRTVSPTEVTITYHPTTAGTHSDNLTISSTGATSLVIPLSGTAMALPKVDIVSLNEDGTFNMDWNTTGDLHVYQKVTEGEQHVAQGLFFSKYFEADGNNKLLEIFNGTANDVSLNGWKVQVFQIGKREVTINWDSTNVMTYALSGTLEKRKSYVLYTKDVGSSCSGSFGSDWHQFSSPNELLFNGNDPIRLVDNNNNIVDIIGQSQGKTPTERWTATKTDGTELKTDRQLLVRNISVISGTNAVSNNTTSFATLGTEWDLYPMDYSPGQPIACNALIEFGNYDYGNIYTTWQEITNAVSNKKVTIPNAANRPCEELKVEVKNGETVTASSYINVPIIVSDAKNIDNYTTLCPTCDMGIKSGGKLTVNEANKSIRNVTVFPNGKLDINQSVTMRNLTLKAGLGSNLFNNFPTSMMRINLITGQLTISENFRYVRTLDDVQWYFIAFPYNVLVSSITAADGSLGTLGTDWFLKYYDGASRIQNLGTISNWKMYTGETLEAGKGYIIGLASGTEEVIFPLGHNLTLSSEPSINIPVSYFGKDAANVTENHKGWNLIGLPFFTKIKGLAANFNYFTFSDGGSSKTYTQVDKYSSSLDGENGLNPFTSFFVQAGNDLEISGISFDLIGRLLLPASVRNETTDKVKIVYQSPTGTDETTLILDDEQTAAYEIGEDLEKWVGTGTPKPQVYTVNGGINYAFNALSYAEAQNLPLAVYTKTSGNHTFHADALQAAGLSQLTLTDKTAGKTVDLLTSDYTYSATAGTNTSRFLISAKKVISSTLPEEKENGIIAFSAYGKIVVNGLPENTTVRLYDTMGRLVAFNPSTQSDKIEIPIAVAGVYQVVVESPNQPIKVVKVIHHPSR
ncbi:MAG: lamin tail domain-containing protein, partial [Paludibacteraceae bacterium]|nr:lamin tail domain-containing protein [Paludibacteraceae bacterium]